MRKLSGSHESVSSCAAQFSHYTTVGRLEFSCSWSVFGVCEHILAVYGPRCPFVFLLCVPVNQRVVPILWLLKAQRARKVRHLFRFYRKRQFDGFSRQRDSGKKLTDCSQRASVGNCGCGFCDSRKRNGRLAFTVRGKCAEQKAHLLTAP